MTKAPIFTPQNSVRRELEEKGTRFQQFLGRGGFSEAWSAESKGANICLKVSIEPLDHQHGKTAVEFNSLDIFKNRQIAMHAYIVKYFGFELIQGHLATYWELGDRTLLEVLDEVQSKQNLPGMTWEELVGDESTRKGYLWSVAQACDDFNSLGHQHRDLKPANLIVFFGNQVKLGDLGLAKFVGASTLRSRHSAGTPGYQPPESMLGEWSRVSDLYSLCATYVKLRTGREPFGEEYAEVYDRQRAGAPVLDGLEEFERGPILQGLAFRPDERPQDGTIALLRSLQPPRVDPTSIPIEAVDIGPVRIEPYVLPWDTSAPPNMPEIPPEIVSLLTEQRAIEQAIDAIQQGTHLALRSAFATLQFAQRQEQEKKADLDAHTPQMSPGLQAEIQRRVIADPDGSVAAILRLAPDVDADPLLQYIVRLRNLQLASRASLDAQAEYQKIAKAEVTKLLTRREVLAKSLDSWYRKDLAQVVARMRESAGQSLRFPLDDWLALQPHLQARYGRRDTTELLTLAEQLYVCNEVQSHTNSIGMEFVEIASGEFDMGSPNHVGGADEHPVHRVRITHRFLLGKFPVTVGQFRRFVNATGYSACGDGWKNPGFHQDDKHPVVNVSHEDALAMAQWLSKTEGRTYSLPTEAEWEYACRAGTTTLHYGGDSPDWITAHANLGRRNGGTTPVGKYAENPWGLSDMLGNCWEWMANRYDANYYRQAPRDNPTGPPQGRSYAVRGGSWCDGENLCRAAYRHYYLATLRNNFVSFRLLLRVT